MDLVCQGVVVMVRMRGRAREKGWRSGHAAAASSMARSAKWLGRVDKLLYDWRSQEKSVQGSQGSQGRVRAGQSTTVNKVKVLCSPRLLLVR